MIYVQDPAVAGLTCTTAVLIGIYSIRRFHALAYSDHKYPKDAQSWTTPFNFVLSTLLYVSIAIVLFALLDHLPALVESLLSAFSVDAPEKVKGWIKTLADEKYQKIATPILAAAALAILFAFEKSPLAFADKWIRKSLQRIASIPTKVRATIAEIEGAEFSLQDKRRSDVCGYFSSLLEKPFNDTLLRNSDSELVDWILKTGSLDFAFHEWKSPQASFARLYEENQQEMADLQRKFEELIRITEPTLELLKQQQSAGVEVAAGVRASDLKRDFSGLFKEQLIPFTCAIVQSSNSAAKRIDHLASFGFVVKKLPKREDVLEFMLEDFSALVFFLILIVYPAVFGIAPLLGWKGLDNGYLDLLLFWPAQLAAFAIAAALPAILWQRPRKSPTSNLLEPKRRRFLGYLLIGTVGGLFGVISIVFLGTIGDMLSSLSVAPLGKIYEKLGRQLPFGLVAATVGIVTAILIDIPIRFPMRFVVDGLLTGAVAGVLAFVAVLAQNGAGVDSIAGVIMQTPEVLKQTPGLRVIPFVLPLVFAMGLCIGLIIPRGFRRYSLGHSLREPTNSLKYMG